MSLKHFVKGSWDSDIRNNSELEFIAIRRKLITEKGSFSLGSDGGYEGVSTLE